ncbi:MAG: patatin-like phospholipase family protein [Anaerolineae bacterium]
MIAFALSGGGNRGALEAGSLEALFEHGIRPDILVGTSAGAMNSAFIATDPSLEGARKLSALWLKVRKQDVYPGNLLTMAWRFITGQDSLVPNDNLRRLVEANMPPGFERFGDITAVRLYITAANLNTATLYLFGDDPSATLIDAVMTSAAIPAILPPLVFDGWQYVDGGVVANVPLSIAVEKGATEVYVINVGFSGRARRDIHGVYHIADQALTTLTYQQLLDDIREVGERPEVTVHHIFIEAFGHLRWDDFDHAAEMVEEGRRVTREYLEGRPPDVSRAFALPEAAPPPPGATIWVPPRRR